MRKGRKNQDVITFKAKSSFVLAVEVGLEKLGVLNRSQFFRDAIAEKLRRMKIDVDATANSRQGVGGRPAGVHYHTAPPEISLANDAASSAADQANQKHLKKIADEPVAGGPAVPEVPPGGPPGPGLGSGSASYLPGSKRKPGSGRKGGSKH